MEPTLIEPLGDCAFLAHFAGEEHARGWAAAVRARALAGHPRRGARLSIRGRLRRCRNRSTCSSWNRGSGRSSRLRSLEPRGRRLVIPVLYDGADLDDRGRSSEIDQRGGDRDS